MQMGVDEIAPLIGVARACQVVGLPRATYYRHRLPTLSGDASMETTAEADDAAPVLAPQTLLDLPAAAPCHPRALSLEERAKVREVLNSERFADCAVRTVYESGEAPHEQILPPLQVGAACNRPSTAPPA